MPMITKVSYSQDGSDTNSVGTPVTTRDSRYAYNSWSHDQYVVSPYNRADIKVTSSITVPNIKSYNWSHDQDW
jgi:hypothetical protein